jgi:hypothetical protein
MVVTTTHWTSLEKQINQIRTTRKAIRVILKIEAEKDLYPSLSKGDVLVIRTSRLECFY